VYDTSGILIGTAVQDIQVFEKWEEKKSMKNFKPNKYGTKFIPWENVSYIQMEGLLVEEPTYRSTSIMYNSSISDLAAWDRQLNTSVFNITQMRQSLDQLIIPEPSGTVYQISWEHILLLVMGTMLLLFAFSLCLYCIIRHKFKIQYIKSDQPNAEQLQHAEHSPLTNHENVIIP
jgi:hypothetical protein